MSTDTDDHGTAHADHRVHFFDSDDGLVDAVSGYLSAAVLDGDSVIIIATPGHRARFEEALSGAGIDLAAVVDGGRLELLDAAETLARFTVDGHPDGAAFDAVVGQLVRDSAAEGRPVRAYGEMVALLWAAGDVAGAMELERLWNRLGEQLPFALFCAYPAHLFTDSAAAEAFAGVCHLHTEVVAGAPTPFGAEAARRFPRTPETSRLARQFVCGVLQTWSLEADVIDDALLVASELVTNAVLHASSDVVVGLARTDGGVRIVVSDTCGREPVARELSPDRPNGRGLAIVNALARGWGHDFVQSGKLVWVDLGTEGVVRPG
jgi:anti-sigma regulatory factor (Ser/Thr protein kinase)